MKFKNRVSQTVYALLQELDYSQSENIEKAAHCLAKTIENGGLIQAFGSGHSECGAQEIYLRAGGYIPTKMIKDLTGGHYEGIEGVGTTLMRRVEIRPEDTLVVISNSGRNPLPIEVAIEGKKRGATVIAVTSLKVSQTLTSRHSSGKNLYAYADIVLDNCVPEGDAAIELKGLETKVCGLSSIATGILIQSAVCRSIELLLAKGIVPPIYKSNNIDGGKEYNKVIEDQLFARLYHQ